MVRRSSTRDRDLLEWPSISPIQPDTSRFTSVSGIVSPDLSTRSQAGTYVSPPSSYKTPPPRPSKPSPNVAVPPTPDPPYYDVAALLQQSWRKAIRVLRANPSLMTRSILCRALRQRPPAYVVEWMVRLNPSAVSLPISEGGPSPLLVAIEEHCSTGVVETLLRASPQALVESPRGSQWDPLALARRVRGNEKDLIAMLRRPVSYWTKECQDDKKAAPESETSGIGILGASKRNSSDVPEVEREEMDRRCRNLEKLRPSPEQTSTPPDTKIRHHMPSLLHRTRPLGTPTKPERRQLHRSTPPAASSKTKSTLNSVERQELDNIKFLCLALLKNHRRDQNDPSNPTTATTTHLEAAEREALLRLIEEKQQKQSRICLIALDMKEKAIRALAKRIEDRLSSSSDSQLSTQLRSSYVHLYYRFLGLEEELRMLKEKAGLPFLPNENQLLEDYSSEHCQAPPSTEKRSAVQVSTPISVAVESALTEESSGERSRSCLRLPWTRFGCRPSG